ncbi:hypothetical protein [Microcoleus sp. herbarium12]|uniref:hypothetical protein n=1 Tax=Microcoleus sp. herbarium12 TaxID=3055437 RepID=UPI002FD2A891
MINTAAAVTTTAAKPNIKNPRWFDKMTIILEIGFGILELDFCGFDGKEFFLSGAGEGFGGLESWRSSGGEFA